MPGPKPGALPLGDVPLIVLFYIVQTIMSSESLNSDLTLYCSIFNYFCYFGNFDHSRTYAVWLVANFSAEQSLVFILHKSKLSYLELEK